MKIVAPFSSLNEIEMLIQNGADELYCGISTPEWLAHFGQLWWMNRRSPTRANLASWSDIKQAIALAHEKKVPVYLTMNAPFYPDGSTGYVLKLVDKLIHDAGIDGLIVSDINFLLHLSKINFPVRIHLSSLGACTNSGTVEFYRSLGVKRIILPRQLRLSEMELLLSRSKNLVEFEVFALNDGCFFEEGFCQTSHAFGPFCLTDWEAFQVRTKDHLLTSQETTKFFSRLKEYLWYQNNCGSTFQENGLPNGPCSLCRFGQFRDWGFTAVKIVGREASFQRKMGSIQLVKAVMDEVRRGGSSSDISQLARDLRRTPEYCDSGCMCYFRDH